MTTTDPRLVAWSVQVLTADGVQVDVRRGRSALFGAFTIALIAVGVLMLLTGGTSDRVWAVLMLGVFVPLLVPMVGQVLRVGSWRSPHVRVDAHGVTVRGGRVQVPWSDLDGAIGHSMYHNRFVVLVTTTEFYEKWIAGLPLVLRAMWRISPRERRSCLLRLPANLAVDNVAFAAWLTEETQDRMRLSPPTSPR